jgi:hypothetical protein
MSNEDVSRINNIGAHFYLPMLYSNGLLAQCSNFSDIFNVGHFIESLKGDVPIVKRLPKALYHHPKVVKQFQSWSSAKYYEEDIVHLWQNHKVDPTLPFCSHRHSYQFLNSFEFLLTSYPVAILQSIPHMRLLQNND